MGEVFVGGLKHSIIYEEFPRQYTRQPFRGISLFFFFVGQWRHGGNGHPCQLVVDNTIDKHSDYQHNLVVEP